MQCQNEHNAYMGAIILDGEPLLWCALFGV